MSEDRRIFAAYPLPPKIGLLNEKPRRESVIERQLEDTIRAPSSSPRPPQRGVNQLDAFDPYNSPAYASSSYSMSPDYYSISNARSPAHLQQTATTTTTKTMAQHPNLSRQQQAIRDKTPDLFADFAQTEAKLLAEIEAINNGYQPSAATPTSWSYRAGVSRPKPRQEPPPHAKKVGGVRQYEFGTSSLSRPSSRASSVRSTTSDDLREKEAKLLADIEDIERKQFKPQTMVLGGARDTIGSNEVHNTLESNSSGVYTTILRTPLGDVDNKSPLPFAYDNFSTKGVRGNIASVGAAEPDNPYPPIYPIIKRSPSPRY